MSMTFDEMRLQYAGFTESVVQKLIQKMPMALEKAQGLDFIPYTVKNGQWQPGPFDGICWWTNGFWPGEMWEMYRLTGDAAYRSEAERAERMLDEAFMDFDHLHHDVGFMWLISAGADFRMTGNDQSRKRALAAANLLAGRYNPLGFIRAWNGDCVGWAIIDCMMNLNLLYWASDFTGDPRFRKIAMAHADTAMKHFIRENGSSNHIVIFDPDTMEVKEIPAGQGYTSGSSWSRGQSWALYGFTLSFLHTQKQEYLETAKKSARYFISQIQDDFIPRCDFCQPREDGLKDAVHGFFADLPEETFRSKEFSNARLVRNLYERTWGKAAYRQSLDGGGDMLILKGDLAGAAADSEFKKLMKKNVERRAIGFGA